MIFFVKWHKIHKNLEAKQEGVVYRNHRETDLPVFVYEFPSKSNPFCTLNTSVPIKGTRETEPFLEDMRFFIQVSCLLAFATVASCNDLVKEKLVGNWKEDQYKRTGLNDFLYEMGKRF